MTNAINIDMCRLNALREMCGYIENSSETYLMIFQDDATRDWILIIGTDHRYYSKSFRGVIDEAMADKKNWSQE